MENLSRRDLLIFLLLGVLIPAATLPAEEVPVRVPEGFEITAYAGDELAHDIFSMTIDARGRVVVAGRGYVKILHDADHDGRAESASLFSRVPKSGAHGMLFDGSDLIATGDNTLMRLCDTDGDGRADGKPNILARLNHSEHGANGIARGPDGWFYVICGNDAGVSGQHAPAARSPVSNPRCGAVVRFTPDGTQSEIVAHGFRNPYDLAFNRHGRMFTVDSDGERDHYLPWYTPTRLFDIAQGMHHGWMLTGWRRSWSRPPSYFDNVERLAEIGRGSPTGVIVYRHRQFPPRYRGGVMSCCWTLGRVYYFPLARSGATYSSRREIFMETTGEVGFAPVDLAVGPAGDLFVAIGGRGTQGGVFRVRYKGAMKNVSPDRGSDPLMQVLAADQPLASWSRARWLPLARKLKRGPFEAAVLNDKLNTPRRIRALEVLTDVFGGISAELAEKVISSGQPELIARAGWALSRQPEQADSEKLLARLTHHGDPRVRRAAWEGLAGYSLLDTAVEAANWHDLASANSRRVRAAIVQAAARVPDSRTQSILPLGSTPKQRLARLWLACNRRPPGTDHPLQEAAEIFAAVENHAIRLEAVRLMQIALGDIRTGSTEPDVSAGYLANEPQRIDANRRQQAAHVLAASFPTASEPLNREMARLLGMLGSGPPGLLEKIVGQWSPTSRVQDDIHYLIVMAQLPGMRSEHVTKRVASALASLHPKLNEGQMAASRNWPLRVQEVFTMLGKRDPALPAALVADSAFGHPGHSLFAALMPGNDRQAAARKLLQAAQESDEDESWTPGLLREIAALPAAESLPVLREQWTNPALRDTIVTLLVSDPQAEDRGRFIEALDSAQPQVVQQAAEALAWLAGRGTADEILIALRPLRQYCTAEQHGSVRKALGRLLLIWTGENIPIESSPRGDLLAVYQPWFDWFTTAHPAQSKRLSGFAGADAAAWKERLEKIDWSTGSQIRGKTVYQQRSCSRCHSSNDRLGPDLAGVVGRFSREDLFAAIVNPNLNVSPLYQTTQLVTGSGKVFHGVIVYESPDGTLLQTGPDTTIRIAGQEIVSTRKSRRSLMPSGLLRQCGDRDLADLYAYLKTLRGRR